MFMEKQIGIDAMVQLVTVAMSGDLKATKEQGDRTMQILQLLDAETRNDILYGSGPSPTRFINEHGPAIVDFARALRRAISG